MQNTYILLRDNKESDALTIEDLRQIGLKETDQIWVECQSMDWRSPREIPELKRLLASGDYNGKINKAEESERTGNYNQLEEKTNGRQQQEAGIKEFEKYSHPELTLLSGFEKKEMYSPRSNTGSAAGVLNEAQPGYPEQNAPGFKNFFTNQLSDRVKKWALYCGLVLTGALLMFLVLNLGGKKTTVVQQMPVPENSVVSTASTTTTSPAQNTDPVIPSENVVNPLSQNSPDSVKKVGKIKVTAPKTISLNKLATPASQDTINNHTEKNIKPELIIKPKPVSMEEISSNIVLTANDYKVGFMGGVRDLEITLQNNSAYLLNNVAVKIDYFNSANEIVNTEQVNFQSVKAGDAKVLEVKKSKRGVKVKYYVTDIQCKALNSQQTAGLDSGNGSTN